MKMPTISLLDSEHICISRNSARKILKKIRTAMAYRDSICGLEKLIEFDDTFIRGKRYLVNEVVALEEKDLFLLP